MDTVNSFMKLLKIHEQHSSVNRNFKCRLKTTGKIEDNIREDKEHVKSVIQGTIQGGSPGATSVDISQKGCSIKLKIWQLAKCPEAYSAKPLSYIRLFR